jgi:hypothetical protein
VKFPGQFWLSVPPDAQATVMKSVGPTEKDPAAPANAPVPAVIVIWVF